MKPNKNQVPQLMLVIVIAKLIGMLRDVVLANYFGTTNVSDAYLIASSVPTLLFYFVGHSISTAYIPMFHKIKTEDGEQKALRFSNNLISAALLVCTLIVAVLLIFPGFVIKVFAAGFDAPTAALAARFVRISAVSLYLMTIIYVFTGYLQANQSFLIPAAVSVPRNFVVILSIAAASAFGIGLLGWGLLAAYVAELLLLLPFTFRKGYRYRPVLDTKDPSMKETLYIVLPILLGLSVSQINKIIDRSLASTVIEGGVSALSYASIMNNAVQEVLVTGIITVLFANCAKLVADGHHNEVKRQLQSTLDTMIFLLVPASFGIIVLAEPIVKIILSRGNFDAVSISLTAGALRCYTVGLVFLAVRDTLVKVFYAYKNTKITTATSISAILINIVLNVILSRFFGINGLAFATSVSVIFNSCILYFLLRKKIGSFGLRQTAVGVLKTVLASAVMVLAVFAISELTANFVSYDVVQLLLAVFVGAVVYFVVSLLLKNSSLLFLLKKYVRSGGR